MPCLQRLHWRRAWHNCFKHHTAKGLNQYNSKSISIQICDSTLLCKNDSGAQWQDMQFVYSVLWAIKDKDLEIIKHDYYTIIDKIKEGKAHEISESDTYYLAACTKGKDGSSLRRQPFSKVLAKSRAFSLKASYMRTVLSFVANSGSNMATNTDVQPEFPQLVSVEELRADSFENIIKRRFEPYYGLDYIQLSEYLGMSIKAADKSKYARIAKHILRKGLKEYNDAEEIRKAGIIAKTIRIEKNGRIKEHMSFENIDYQEIHETDDWENSRWYEIVHSRMMLIVFRQEDSYRGGWEKEKRYVLDKIVFTSLPDTVLAEAKEYWWNIKENVEKDTLYDNNEETQKEKRNTFWRLSDGRHFHVRPKAQTSRDMTESPLTGEQVKKKCYWLDNKYLANVVRQAYGDEWENKFRSNG